VTGETGGRKDPAHIDANWAKTLDLIDGVRLHEVRNVVTFNGVTTEVHRADWNVAGGDIVHIVHVALRPGVVSAWHMHRHQTDHVFCVSGTLKVVLYDDREGSRTRGKVDELVVSPYRPTLLVIPPGLWHGVVNIAGERSCFVNYFDRAYDYADPDEWRLPPDSEQIPYRF